MIADLILQLFGHKSQVEQMAEANRRIEERRAKNPWKSDKVYDEWPCPKCGSFTLVVTGNTALCGTCSSGFVKK